MLINNLIMKGLSNREAELTEMVFAGATNKQIAHSLYITEKTVKFHLVNIYKKLLVKSRAELIVYCLPLSNRFVSESVFKTECAKIGPGAVYRKGGNF